MSTNAPRTVTLPPSDSEHDRVLIPEKWELRDQMHERLCPEGCGEIGEGRSLMFSALPRLIWFRIGLVQVWKWG